MPHRLVFASVSDARKINKNQFKPKIVQCAYHMNLLYRGQRWIAGLNNQSYKSVWNKSLTIQYVLTRHCFRTELYVILGSDDVSKQTSSESVIRPSIPYEEVYYTRVRETNEHVSCANLFNWGGGRCLTSGHILAPRWRGVWYMGINFPPQKLWGVVSSPQKESGRSPSHRRRKSFWA